jgi:hypothetical protein
MAAASRTMPMRARLKRAPPLERAITSPIIASMKASDLAASASATAGKMKRRHWPVPIVAEAARVTTILVTGSARSKL